VPLVLLALVVVALMIGSAKRALAYVRGQPLMIDLVPIGGGHQLEARAAASWLELAAKARDQGLVLEVNSSFRSMEEQTLLWQAYQAGQGNLAAKPGYSNHQNGIALDVAVGGSFTSTAYKWLAANAPAYGWINTGKTFSQPEPWHWEWKGTA
jgi:LAS superfamily LD-carboxypeptidase LdcB